MRNKIKRVGFLCLISTLAATGLSAQTPPAEPESFTESIHGAAEHIRNMFTVAAEEMSEEDYAFRPTPEVRSFGELLAHVANTNYWFCSVAMEKETPVTNIEKTMTSRADLQKVLAESFEYCEGAHAAMADEANASRTVEIMGKPRPALAALNFLNYHSLLHWGNAITYMRLRGKVPPSN